jgi:hypothetical protein
MEKEENLDTKFAKGLFSLISFVMTTGWLIYGLVKHEWLLIVAVLSTMIGTTIAVVLKNR